MLETHIAISLLIFRLVLILVLHLISFKDLTIAHIGSRENSFVPRRFGHNPFSHHGDRAPHRHSFLAGWSYTCFESRHLDGPCFLGRGSRPTGSNHEVQKTVKTFSANMVKCWIPKFYLTNPSTEPLTFSHPMHVIDGGLVNKWLMDSGCSRHMTKNKK
jgi:hypothetical protein